MEAVLLMCFVGLLNGASLVLIALCCDLTKCFSFREMGERTLGLSFGLLHQAVKNAQARLAAQGIGQRHGCRRRGAGGKAKGQGRKAAACQGLEFSVHQLLLRNGLIGRSLRSRYDSKVKFL